MTANSVATYASFSSEATRVVFTSNATNLSAADTDSTPDVYVRTLATGAFQLVSTNAAGVKANGGSVYGQLSPDGSRVASITTATNLGYADAANRAELVVKDLASSAVTLVSSWDLAKHSRMTEDPDVPAWKGDSGMAATLASATSHRQKSTSPSSIPEAARSTQTK